MGGANSGLDPVMRKVFFLCWIAVIIVMVVILLDRYAVERLRHETEELRFELESRASAVESIGKVRG